MTFPKLMNEMYPQEHYQEYKRTEKENREDAHVLEMHILSEVCKAVDRVIYDVDFDITKHIDADWLAEELAEYIKGDFQ